VVVQSTFSRVQEHSVGSAGARSQECRSTRSGVQEHVVVQEHSVGSAERDGAILKVRAKPSVLTLGGPLLGASNAAR
jgi:hypothetical protein